MKIRRIVSSLALAVAVAIGASGCGLMASMNTKDPYAPSDGIDVDLNTVAVRNLMLIEDSTGENFNVVFTAVNNGTTPAQLNITFVSDSGSTTASADFSVAVGSTLFGDPAGSVSPTLVSIPGLIPGATVNAFLEVSGGDKVERRIPALDGTLDEYKDFVL